VFGKHTVSNTEGYLAGDWCGAYGKYDSHNNYGYLGSAEYGAYGYNGSGTHGYLGGAQHGVYGETGSADGAGVRGVNTGDGTGVYGQSGNGAAVYAMATGSSGVGIYAEGLLNGYAADFVGRVRIRSSAGTSGSLELGEGLDYAEGFDVSEPAAIESGSVLVIDPDHPGELALSRLSYDRRVAGVVAGANGLGSGVRLGVGRFDHDVALAGRVYCNVDASVEGIEPGDLLTTSSVPGYAMKAVEHDRAQGAILGKAMERLSTGTRGRILILVTLQ
jgi:hypothetical protein